MRGGFRHEYMIDTLDGEFCNQGLAGSRQFPVWSNRIIGYVDFIVVNESGQMICLEIETSIKRIFSDVKKAVHLSALLWIVTANSRLRDNIKARLNSSHLRENDFISVLTLGQAVYAIRNKIPFSFWS